MSHTSCVLCHHVRACHGADAPQDCMALCGTFDPDRDRACEAFVGEVETPPLLMPPRMVTALEESTALRKEVEEARLDLATLHQTVAALAEERDELRRILFSLRDGGCFGRECFVGFSDGHSPECVAANAALDVWVDGSAWAHLNGDEP